MIVNVFLKHGKAISIKPTKFMFKDEPITMHIRSFVIDSAEFCHDIEGFELKETDPWSLFCMLYKTQDNGGDVLCFGIVCKDNKFSFDLAGVGVVTEILFVEYNVLFYMTMVTGKMVFTEEETTKTRLIGAPSFKGREAELKLVHLNQNRWDTLHFGKKLCIQYYGAMGDKEYMHSYNGSAAAVMWFRPLNAKSRKRDSSYMDYEDLFIMLSRILFDVDHIVRYGFVVSVVFVGMGKMLVLNWRKKMTKKIKLL